MDTLQREELLQYIKSAIEVETDIATQEQIGINFQTTQENRKPSLDLEEEPVPPDYDFRVANENPNVIIGLGIAAFLLLFLIGLGYSSLGIGFVLGLTGFGLLFPLCFSLPMFIIKQKKTREYNQEYSIYSDRMQKVKQNNNQKQQQYHINMREWNTSFESINREIASHLSETKAILAKLYSRNLIYPKYCTLPALTSIYEYFVTGRCDDLTGPNGAYNMYEDEVRKDTVIAQLNAINENLEKIKQNQYMLYQQVISIRENTDIISNELHQIRGYSFQIAQFTALNAYYSSLNERNTRVLMYYHL